MAQLHGGAVARRIMIWKKSMNVVANRLLFILEGVSRGFLITIGMFGLFSLFYVGSTHLPTWALFTLFLMISLIINLDFWLFVILSLITIGLSIYLIYVSMSDYEIFAFAKEILLATIIFNVCLLILKTIQYITENKRG